MVSGVKNAKRKHSNTYQDDHEWYKLPFIEAKNLAYKDVQRMQISITYEEAFDLNIHHPDKGIQDINQQWCLSATGPNIVKLMIPQGQQIYACIMTHSELRSIIQIAQTLIEGRECLEEDLQHSHKKFNHSTLEPWIPGI
jgi:hypothetical protein